MADRIDDEITFRKLEVLLAFLETGNLARAAERLGASTVAVHRALHSLEAGARCALFRHEGRSLIPTDAAQVLADTAREVLRTMGDGLRATREAAGHWSDRLRIGSLYSLTRHTVPTIVLETKIRKPDLQTELVLGSNAGLLQRLRDGTIDAALMALPDNAADIESEPLFDDAIFFAAPVGSPFDDVPEVDLAGCADQRFVSLGEGFVTYGGFIEACRIAGFVPEVTVTTGDIFSLMNLVAGGMGFALLPGRVRDVMPQRIRLIPLQPRYAMRQVIGLSFLRIRERDPNLLALLAVCRAFRSQLAGR